MAEMQNLFEAYKQSKLPNTTGFIITQNVDDRSLYTKFEIISYGNVKDIYQSEEGITFQADGRKLYIMFEPVSFTGKQTEPCYRTDKYKIPYRFKELEILTTKRQDKVMIGKEPVESYTSFTILNPSSMNVSYIISGDDRNEIAKKILTSIHEMLWKTTKMTQRDADSAIEILGHVLPLVMAPYGLT
jgi:hypothetical protein